MSLLHLEKTTCGLEPFSVQLKISLVSKFGFSSSRLVTLCAFVKICCCCAPLFFPFNTTTEAQTQDSVKSESSTGAELSATTAVLGSEGDDGSCATEHVSDHGNQGLRFDCQQLKPWEARMREVTSSYPQFWTSQSHVHFGFRRRRRCGFYVPPFLAAEDPALRAMLTSPVIFEERQSRMFIGIQTDFRLSFARCFFAGPAGWSHIECRTKGKKVRSFVEKT